MDIKEMTIGYINDIYAEESIASNALISSILELEPKNINFIAEDERAFPGDEKFVASGYFHTMLKRYFFAASVFCRDKKVLDTCCGTGWGTYIISQFAKTVDAFDIDENVITFCKDNWNATNCTWYVDSATEFSHAKGNYDVSLAMETIEHFEKEEIIRYLDHIEKQLVPGGVLIGTSAFPAGKDQAIELCKKNKYHKCILTLDEITSILSSKFSEHTVINNWMFIAKK